ncbi:hypothetical protein [Caenibius tardaugens]|uniref:hypothetical protein n=1 Tax=Caenibius tardaugens TaxID=169176 RepID=UPI000F5F6A3D|nr:hypothetical protein [Caenibius tardaugens]AZI36297.1 hypothetical protein EGO55_10300 [Caenibius tardaugens NBRC 16725]
MRGKHKARGRGRPPGSVNTRTLVHDLAGDTIMLRDAGGVSRQVSIVEALLLALRNLAMTGDIEAAKRLEQLHRMRVPEPTDGSTQGLLLVPEALSVEEWARQEDIRCQHTQPPEMPAAVVQPQAHTAAAPVVQRPPSNPGGPSPRRSARLIR